MMCIASSRRSLSGSAAWSVRVGRIATTPEALRLFADSLGPEDEIALEATGNTHAIARLLERRVARVVVVNPAKKVSQYLAECADRAAPNWVGET